jgi:regulatory protein
MSPKAAIRIERIVKKGRDYLVHYSEKEGSDDAGKVSAILLDEEQLVSYRILKDKEYDSATWRKIEKEAGEIVGYKKALSFINYQARTEHEIREYLRTHNMTAESIEIIVKRLKKANFIDDRQYAMNYVDNYLRNLKGPLYLKYRLQEKGVDSKIISQVIEGISENVQKELIMQIIEKEKPRLETYPVKRQKEMILQKCLRDGFKGDLVLKCFAQVKWQSLHQDRLKVDFQKISQKEHSQQKIIQKLLAKVYTLQEIKALMEESEGNLESEDYYFE